MKKTGDILKKSREEKQLSIHEIGLSLKINSKILKAIEEGDIKNLPAKTFLRGFVQSYAQYLKLNPDEILKIFTDEMGTTKPQALPVNIGVESSQNVSVVLPSAKSQNKKDNNLNEDDVSATITSGKQFRTVSVVASVIVLLTLILITKRIIDKYQSETVTSLEETQQQDPVPQVTHVSPVEPALPSLAAPANNAATDPTSNSVAATTASTATAPSTATTTAPTTASTITATGQNTQPATQASGAFVSSATTGPSPKSTLPQQPKQEPPSAQPSPSPNSTNQVKVPSANTVTTAPAQSPPTQTASTQTASPEKTPSAEKLSSTETKPTPAPKNVELIIEAFDAVDIEYSTTNGKNEKMRLEPEQLHTIKTKSGLKLNVSNGGAVNIIVNGKDVGVPGTLGKPIKLTF